MSPRQTRWTRCACTQMEQPGFIEPSLHSCLKKTTLGSMFTPGNGPVLTWTKLCPSTDLTSKDGARHKDVGLMSEDPLTVDQKWEYIFTGSPHHPFITAKLCLEIQHFFISKRQYFVSTVLPKKKIFENFSPSQDAVTSVVLMKQVMWSPSLPQINIHAENHSSAANGSNQNGFFQHFPAIPKENQEGLWRRLAPSGTQTWGCSGFSLASMVFSVD